MNELTKRQALLLGLDNAWHVSAVDPATDLKRVETTIESTNMGGIRDILHYLLNVLHE